MLKSKRWKRVNVEFGGRKMEIKRGFSIGISLIVSEVEDELLIVSLASLQTFIYIVRSSCVFVKKKYE